MARPPGLLTAEHQGPASLHYQRDSTGALTAMRLPDGRPCHGSANMA
jgi:YD repeat-containing protein